MLQGEAGDLEFVLGQEVVKVHAGPRFPEISEKVSKYLRTRGSEELRKASRDRHDTNFPSSSSAMRVPSRSASRTSWVTNTTDLFNFCCRDRNSCCTSARVCGYLSAISSRTPTNLRSSAARSAIRAFGQCSISGTRAMLRLAL